LIQEILRGVTGAELAEAEAEPAKRPDESVTVRWRFIARARTPERGLRIEEREKWSASFTPPRARSS
jgi:hypothetical protein